MRTPSHYFSSLFLNDIWPEFSKTLRKQHTKDTYFSAVCHICDSLKMDFLDIGTTDAQAYFHLLEESKLTSKSIVSKLSIFKSISNFILLNKKKFFSNKDYINPFTLVKVEPTDSYIKAKDIPTLKELDEIFFCIRNNDMLFLIVSLVFRCSLTENEICRLKPTQISQDPNGTCFITFSKNGRIRHVLVPEDVMKLIIEYIGRFGEQEYFFYNNWNRVLNPRNLQYTLKNALESSQLEKKYTLQDIRNASLFYMLKSGAPGSSVASHAGISSFWIYRYNKALTELKDSPVNLVHIKIERSNKSV